MSSLRSLTLVVVTIALAGLLATIFHASIGPATACAVSGLVGSMVVAVFNQRRQRCGGSERI
jgi:hypothetical protein